MDEARHVMVLSGAGMSAESGIPTFRDAQTGIWAKFRAEDLATPEAFAANPGRVWHWYEDRRETVRSARPHGGHHALVQLESMVPSLSLITQNVDGLHQLAGSKNVTELHGNILRSRCHVTGRAISAQWIADSTGDVPRSPYIGHGFARPDVVWFGETLPRHALEAAMEAAVGCDFCISAGTTSLVQPAASLPLLALEHGAAVIEINPMETPLSPHANQCLRGPASEVLSTLIQQLKSWRQDAGQGA
ncbi:MAG: NAD-dependent deacylase [Xanthomonadales bacterium]|nr:NAD-dependent deacylase [Gammaproteobacteria bacterium]MBT8053339.1 NAD-dependent deacylase [Gammaproteobacteria bacterium]NND58051.1 NAD-dependent deacylase [Xanthomonadales bacterium]NNK52148.1 NAD-dependent deacylase [Xanthomonadales bacterium]